MKALISLLLCVFFTCGLQQSLDAETYEEKDSQELRVKDMLLLFLGPSIEEATNDYYSKRLKESPLVYPYQVKVLSTERVDGFRSFHFKIKLEVTPVIGPHISVGKDHITFEIAPTISNNVKLLEFKHIETHTLPSHWKHLEKD